MHELNNWTAMHATARLVEALRGASDNDALLAAFALHLKAAYEAGRASMMRPAAAPPPRPLRGSDLVTRSVPGAYG